MLGELLSGDARIKASRCSINKKSKYNTYVSTNTD